MIQLFYGMGKGKTSALNGSAVRAKGAGFSVTIYRFLKGVKTNEDDLLKQMGINVVSLHPSPKFVIQMNDDEKKLAREAIVKTFDLMREDKSDVIILDEFLDLTYDNVKMSTVDESVKLIKDINDGREIIISGHNEVKELFDLADLISFIKPEKHYYWKGVKARKGFEF